MTSNIVTEVEGVKTRPKAIRRGRRRTSHSTSCVTDRDQGAAAMSLMSTPAFAIRRGQVGRRSRTDASGGLCPVQANEDRGTSGKELQTLSSPRSRRSWMLRSSGRSVLGTENDKPFTGRGPACGFAIAATRRSCRRSGAWSRNMGRRSLCGARPATDDGDFRLGQPRPGMNNAKKPARKRWRETRCTRFPIR